MNYLLFQAYGHHDNINEAMFALLSWLKNAGGPQPGTRVVIYTDDEDTFIDTLGPETWMTFEHLSEPQVKFWRGPSDFVHRVKIKVIQHFCTRYEGNFLYLDSDIWLTQPLQPLFARIAAGEAVMHTREGTLQNANNLSRKIGKFLEGKTFELDGQPLEIDRSTPMWNAGAIGLRTDQAGPLLEQVLTLTDKVYPLYPKHTIEQLAFSFILNRAKTIVPAEDAVFHYWHLKELRPVLRRFFERYRGQSLDVLLEKSSAIDPVSLAAPKEAFLKQPGLVRAFKRMLGQEWKMPTLALD